MQGIKQLNEEGQVVTAVSKRPYLEMDMNHESNNKLELKNQASYNGAMEMEGFKSGMET